MIKTAYHVFIIFLFLLTVGYCKSLKKDKMENKKTASHIQIAFTEQVGFLEKIKNITKRDFIGQPVANYLKSNYIKDFRQYIFIDEKPGLLKSINLIYENDLSIEVEVHNYSFLNPFDEKRKWDINLFKKEKISSIRIMQKRNLIKDIK